jgi:hypothetical protein
VPNDVRNGLLARLIATVQRWATRAQWLFFGQYGTQMAIVSIDADIKAKWPQGQCSYSPGSPEELAIIAIDLLFKALGTAGTQAFVSQVFEKYPHDHSASNSSE